MTDSTSQQPGRIVVGVDGSDPSKAALAWAAGQAELTHAPLEVVWAWEFPPMYGFAIGIPEDMDLAAEAEEQLQKVLGEVLGPEPAVEVVPTVVEGHPALVLQDLSADAGLLVVGCRGLGAFRGMVLGSVSAFLASHARCPVLIVHAPRAAEHAKH
ncbi:MAG TPA: universal stress protein [Acidimicrobiales bacterium]|nr:universal stress protein [Acidimicrobiales bacterium]